MPSYSGSPRRRRWTRIVPVVAIAVTAAASVTAVAASASEPPVASSHILIHLDITAGQRPENVAVEPDGNLDLSMSQAAQVVRLTPGGRVSLIASLPHPADGGVNVPVVGFALTTGLVRAADGTLYVGYEADSDSLNGVWRIRPGGKPVRIIPMPASSFPNGMAIDPATQQLYIADSTGNNGQIWRAPLSGGPPSVWYAGPEVKLTGLYGLGVNGLKFHRGAVWVTNFDQGTILRIPVGPTGHPGLPQIKATVPGGPDDFTFVNSSSDTIIAALDPADKVVLVRPDGSYETLLTHANGLEGPTSAALDDGRLYVFSAAYITLTDPNVIVARLAPGLVGAKLTRSSS